jgi:DNA-binding transcriptional ArsR family regulator
MKQISDIADARLVKALAHPLRIQIMGVLERQDASPKEISAELGVPIANVSYHMRQLKSMGLVRIVKRTQRRGAIEHHYRADRKPQISDKTWDEIPDMVKQAMTGAALEQTMRQVKAGAEMGGFERPEAHLSRTQVTLDKKGWADLAVIYRKLLEEIDRVSGESTKRLEKSDHDGGASATAVLMLFEGVGAGSDETHDGAKKAGRQSRKRSSAAR